MGATKAPGPPPNPAPTGSSSTFDFLNYIPSPVVGIAAVSSHIFAWSLYESSN